MLSIVVATDINNVIGGDDETGHPIMPWHCPEDLGVFKRITINGTVIMGRRTFDSLPAKFKPLPNRKNIVISKSMYPNGIPITVIPSFEHAMMLYKDRRDMDVFIIGGASIYEQAMEHVDTIYKSLIYDKHGVPLELDQSSLRNIKKFPEIDMNKFYKQLTTCGDTMELTVYNRRKNNG